MVDMAISAAISSLKVAVDIAGAFSKLRDDALIQGKVIELQAKILEAQSSAIVAQSEQVELLEKLKELRDQIVSLEAWDREKSRYELRDIGNSCFAYVLREETQNGEPNHSICANCYQQRRKSILQRFLITAGRAEAMQCHSCGSEMIVKGIDHREANKLAARRPIQ